VGDSVFLRNDSAQGSGKLDKARMPGASNLTMEIQESGFIDSFVGSIVDDEAGWPNEGSLSLTVCVRAYLRRSNRSYKRLEWLKRQRFHATTIPSTCKGIKEAGDDDGGARSASRWTTFMEASSGRLVGRPNGRAKELLRALAAAVAAFFLE